MTQLALLILSGAAVGLVTSPDNHLRLLGCACGLLGQPLWIWSAWRARQWGILALSLWYTWAWGRGLVNEWRE